MSGPCKADELATWRAFVASQPESSYLASYLQGGEDILRHAMADDMCCQLVAEIKGVRDYATREAAEAELRLAAARKELATARKELEAVHGEKRYVAGLLKQLAALACEAHSAAARADTAGRLALKAG